MSTVHQYDVLNTVSRAKDTIRNQTYTLRTLKKLLNKESQERQIESAMMHLKRAADALDHEVLTTD